jgi:hypothetical protein
MIKILKYAAISYALLLAIVYLIAMIIPAPSADIREGFAPEFSSKQ